MKKLPSNTAIMPFEQKAEEKKSTQTSFLSWEKRRRIGITERFCLPSHPVSEWSEEVGADQ
ncbi:hypothetical protein AVEN_52523-1, partial [Araneus ventricosus]